MRRDSAASDTDKSQKRNSQEIVPSVTIERRTSDASGGAPPSRMSIDDVIAIDDDEDDNEKNDNTTTVSSGDKNLATAVDEMSKEPLDSNTDAPLALDSLEVNTIATVSVVPPMAEVDENNKITTVDVLNKLEEIVGQIAQDLDKETSKQPKMDCLNLKCKKLSIDMCISPVFVSNVYGVTQKPNKTYYVCDDCYDDAMLQLETYCSAVTEGKALLQLGLPVSYLGGQFSEFSFRHLFPFYFLFLFRFARKL